MSRPQRKTYFTHSDSLGAELHFGSRDDAAAVTITTAVRREMHSIWLTKADAVELSAALLEWALSPAESAS